jgi:hypothetical protein
MVRDLEEGLSLSPSPFSLDPEGTNHKHSIHLLCKDTSEPIGEPITDLAFSSIQIHPLMPNCHIRGEFLAVTCDAPLSSGEIAYTVKLFHWKTGQLLLSTSDPSIIFTIRAARSILVCRSDSMG